MKRVLGQGLDALFGGADIKDAIKEESSGEVKMIKTSLIEPRRDQPRKNFDREQLQALANSISEHGVIQPIIVVEGQNGYYSIIAGERRWRASKLAGLSKVPVIVKTYNERQIKEISLIENLQREDLNPIEAATAMRSLMNDYGMTAEDLADRIGKSRPAIANTLRLLNLSQEVIKMVANGALSAGHARALISVPHTDQIKMAEVAVKDGLSVRDVEKKVKDYFMPPEEKAKKKIKQELSLELKELIGDMQRVLGTKVNAIGNDKKGRIYIDYYTRDDLDRISDIIEHLKTTKI